MTVTPLSSSVSPQLTAPDVRPDKLGRFGRFGGKYVPETLMPALAELEEAFYTYRNEAGF